MSTEKKWQREGKEKSDLEEKVRGMWAKGKQELVRYKKKMWNEGRAKENKHVNEKKSCQVKHNKKKLKRKRRSNKIGRQ